MQPNFLEWRSILHLSGDKTGIEEVANGLDFHTDNQNKFKLPDRLTAKKFLFRNIYCPYSIADETAYAYSVDNDFKHIGGRKFWRQAIEVFYDKYPGIRRQHTRWIQEATTTGKVVSDTGRIYPFSPKMVRGEMKYPLSDIVNYPNQGLGADLMMLARVMLRKRLWIEFPQEMKDREILFVNTVHDSIVLDVDGDKNLWYNIYITVKKVFADLQPTYEKIYHKKFLVPLDCDGKYGMNWLEMEPIEKLKEK